MQRIETMWAHAFGAAILAGGEVPSLEEVLDDFTRGLEAAPKTLGAEELDLRVSLGLGGGSG